MDPPAFAPLHSLRLTSSEDNLGLHPPGGSLEFLVPLIVLQ